MDQQMADVVPLAALGARFCDIALNFSDDMFDGVYHNKARHKPDRAAVLQRAAAVGCDSMLIIAGSLEDAYRCVALCAEFNGTSACRMATTIGFHPTRCLEARALDQDLESRLSAFVQQHSSVVAAIGEIGLDYDRLEFCPANVQLEYFELQLRVLTALLPDRPLLLHMRNSECFADFCRVLEQHMAHTETRRLSGVVHSFTGTRDEMERLVALGLSIGINGCSLRDAVFLQHVLPYIPAEHLLYETDAPYCDVRATHPGWSLVAPLVAVTSTVVVSKPEKFLLGCMVKGRNEPANIVHVHTICAALRHADPLLLAARVHDNSMCMFPLLRAHV